jgi:hypothetical protein
VSDAPPGRAAARRGAGVAPRRRVVRIAPAGAVCLALLSTTAARSDPDFGTLGLNASRFGSVVSIRTPSTSLNQPQDEFVVQRDAVQSQNSDPGLIQAGIYRSGSGIGLDNCGAHTAYVIFTEVKAANSPAYRCQLYTDLAPGSILTLDIFRFKTAGTWGMRINGVQTSAIYRLGFSRGDPAIGTEIQSIGTGYQTQTSTHYEPAGDAQWTVYTTAGRQHVHRVTRRDSLSAYPMEDHFWKITRPPAAVTITHREP